MTTLEPYSTKSRYYVKGTLKLLSPISIGSGESINSHNDILRNWDSEPFIPGSSIAGAIKAYLKESGVEGIEALFGIGDDGNHHNSRIIIYDAFLLGDQGKIEIRDGVKIGNEIKTAIENSKHDRECLEGATFSFKMELYSLQKDKPNEYFEEIIHYIVNALKESQIYLGGKTSRGFGKITLIGVQMCRFYLISDGNPNQDAINKWIDFDWNDFPKECLFEIDPERETQRENECFITVDFNIPYSLMIRKPSLVDRYDYEHIKSMGNPIIPGTSWAGLLRKSIHNFKNCLNKEKIEELENSLFGYVEQDTKIAYKARIIIEESIIENAHNQIYTRNRIDRFSNSTVDGALFNPMASYQGNTTLTLKIRNAENKDIGLILLAIFEIWNGIQPIGGETGIGRGILEGEKITVSYKNEVSYKNDIIESKDIIDKKFKKFLKSLAEYCRGEKNE